MPRSRVITNLLPILALALVSSLAQAETSPATKAKASTKTASPAPSQIPPAAATPALSEKAPQNARELMVAMATISGLEARFVEKKTLALLKAPLTSEGHLYYMRGGYLARITEKPSHSSVRITPSALEVDSGKGYQRIDLTGRADIKLFVESFAKVLAGDSAALATLYDIAFAKDAATGGWSLKLKPRSGNLVHLVKELELIGKGYQVVQLRVLETKGDSSSTDLELVSATRSFSAEEQRSLFGIETPNAPSAPAGAKAPTP